MFGKGFLARGLKAFFVCAVVVIVTIVGSEARTVSTERSDSWFSDIMEKVQGYVSRVSERSWTSESSWTLPLGGDAGATVANADHTKSVKLSKSDPIESSAADPCMDGTVISEAAVVGDRLQIRFFEKAAFSPPSSAGASPANDVVFERLDLSGVYEVGEDGTVSLPFIGRIEVVAKRLACVESLVTKASLAATQAQTTVSASFAARPPILVKGAVRAPGAYQFSPGMTVETLLALAGEPGNSGVALAGQRMRLVARRREIDRSALGVRIEWDRLRAALAGRRELSFSGDDRLRSGATLGPSRIASETEALEAELDATEAREAANQSELAGLDEQIAAHESYLSMVEKQYNHHSQLLQKLRDLHARRVASMRQREQVEMNIVTVVQAKLSVEKYLTELRARRNSLQHRAKVEAAERRERLTRQIRDLAEENDALEAQRATVDAEFAALGAGNSEDRAGSALAVLITRKFKDGTQRIKATPQTELTPSDLVTVSIGFPAEPLASLPRRDRFEHQLTVISGK